MEYKQYTAKTVNDAITNATVDLEVPSSRLDYEVVQEPTNGFLGIGSKPAVIKARVREEKKSEPEKTEIKAPADKTKNAAPKEDDVKILTNDIIEQRAAAAAARTQTSGGTDAEVRPARKKREKNNSAAGKSDQDRRKRRSYDRPKRENTVSRHEPSKPKPERIVTPKSEEEVAEITKKANDFLKDVFGAMNLDVKMESSYDQTDGSLNIVFSGDEMGILIGKRGQTLDSLQYLTSLVVNKGQNDYIRIKLDTEDYRGRREETLNNLARNIAFKVRKTHRPVSLEPMNPYERRIIHSALQNNKFVETYSEGEEPYRHVVVAPKR